LRGARAHTESRSDSSTTFKNLDAIIMSGVVINAETFGKRIKKLYDGWRVRYGRS